VQNFGGSTPLWVALTEKNRDSYEALLEYGADPNVIMSGRRVVTHWAASEEDPWWLRLALEHGADPNLVNVGRGRPSEGTPLHFALGKRSQLTHEDAIRGDGKFLDNVKLPVEHGADIDKPWPPSHSFVNQASGGRTRNSCSGTKFTANSLIPFGHGWKSAASMCAENDIPQSNRMARIHVKSGPGKLPLNVRTTVCDLLF
jgi:hypothetical protein